MHIVTILFFATLKDLAQRQSMTMELPQGATVAELKTRLVERIGALELAMPTCIVAVNQEFALDAEVIPNGAEVAIFPPVSGGNGQICIVQIIREEIQIERYHRLLVREDTGAVCTFTGYVRGLTTEKDPRQTTWLQYEAYEPMAKIKMEQIATEIFDRWSKVQGVALVQRIDRIEVSEPSVLVACASEHRDAGIFEAAQYGIERLKEIVPIWKKEVGPAGEEWIEGEYVPGVRDKTPLQDGER